MTQAIHKCQLFLADSGSDTAVEKQLEMALDRQKEAVDKQSTQHQTTIE